MKTSSFFIYLTVLLIFLLSVSGCNTGNQYNIIPLEGTWNFRIDSLDLGIEKKWYNKTFSDTIHLPGTTDEAGYGKKTTGSAYGNLTREYEYIGPAWYRRSIQIPASWAGKNVWLLLERVLWESRVYIDGIEISVLDALGTPHLHDLGNLEPGNHMLTIRINNDMIHNTGDKGHAYTDFTQSIWNGIVGRIELQAKDPVHIYNIKTFPKLSEDKLNIEMQIKATELIEKKFNVAFHIIEINSGKKVISSEEKITISNSKELLSISIPAENKLKPWDEFNPTVYKLICRLIQNNKIIDQYDLEFGFREVSHDGTRILVNNKPVFLRGNLDCVHFPLTGYPSCNVEDWERIFKIYKDYGLNHVRFHSWCPPEAAFQAADRLGIYIQAEVIWVDGWMSEDMTAKGRPEMNTKGHPAGLGFNASRDKFVVAEINRMIDTYGNHPSFIMFCIGNELGNSDFEVMQNWISKVKEKDPRRLYAASTARTITKSDDYSVTHHIPGVGRTRGLNGPQTDWDFEETYSQMNIPIIAHEIGQWPVYPPWSEIDKYTGVLKARNLEDLKKLADRNGISDQDKDLHAASGALNQIMYKYEIESFLRTRSCAGVQLLSMQDYQGQGEALIGWLDCFWEDKGITTPEMFKEHFNTTVPLLRINKFIWQRNDTIRGTAHLFHYGEKDIINSQCWYKIISENNEVLDEGSFVANDYRRGTLTKLGNIVFKPEEDESAEKLTIRIGLYDTDYKNEWGIWVFPEKMANIKNHDILISTTFNKTVKEALKKGKKVLLVANNPGNKKNSVEANFYPLYWSLSWFPGQGKTNIGLLLKENHAAFEFFPTDFHSDWQWEAISKNAKGFILNELPSDYKPIAQPVDDFHRNNKTGSIFELKVGTGKLLVCGYPVQDKKNPVARQLLYSLKHYMISDKFNPEQETEIAYLEKMFIK